MTTLKLAFLLALSLPAAAQAPDPCATAPQTCATLINTHSSASTRLPNTAADVSVGVLAYGKDVPTVQRALTDQSNQLLSYLRGEKAGRLLTADLSFTPDTRSQKNQPDKIVGYSGSVTVTFRTTPERAPDLLAGVLTHGANNINSTAFTPTEDEIAAARRQLAADATRAAIAQADAIAQAAGLHTVSIRNVNVEAGSTFQPRMYSMAKADRTAMMDAPAPAPVAVSAGDQSFSMGVDVTTAATR